MELKNGTVNERSEVNVRTLRNLSHSQSVGIETVNL